MKLDTDKCSPHHLTLCSVILTRLTNIVTLYQGSHISCNENQGHFQSINQNTLTLLSRE